jgi:hypothetical protein
MLVSIQNWFNLPTIGLAIALILTVIGGRLTTSGANTLLLVGWVLAGVSLFWFPLLKRLPWIPRSLCTMLLASVLGLILYGFRWTDEYKEHAKEVPPAQATAPAEPNRPIQSVTQTVTGSGGVAVVGDGNTVETQAESAPEEEQKQP